MGLQMSASQPRKHASISLSNFYLPGTSVDRKQRHLSSICWPLKTGNNSTEVRGTRPSIVLKSIWMIPRQILFLVGCSHTLIKLADRCHLTKRNSGNPRFTRHQCLQIHELEITPKPQLIIDRPNPQLLDPVGYRSDEPFHRLKWIQTHWTIHLYESNIVVGHC